MPTAVLDKPQTKRTPGPESAGEPDRRRYIYCIIDCDEPKRFDCDAVGDGARDRAAAPSKGVAACEFAAQTPPGRALKRPGRVHTVVHNGIAAVVSPTSTEKYPVNRDNTLAHQRVMEHVMEQGHTVLPVKFDTIAEAKNGVGVEERIAHQALARRFDELSSLLAGMGARSEMGLKALWPDMNAVFREIVDSSDEIKRLRRKITGSAGGAQFGTRVKLGELVKNALDAKKEREQKAILGAIRHTLVDFRRNKLFGDQMFANFAFLLEKSQVAELDRKLDELSEASSERIKVRYVGPVPPSNFIELTITWDE